MSVLVAVGLGGCAEPLPMASVDTRPRVGWVEAVAPPPATTRAVPAVVAAWRDASLTPLRGGHVARRPVSAGDRVAAGAVILALEDREARAVEASARAAVREATAVRDEAVRRLRRLEALERGASDAQVDEAASALARAEAAVARAEAEADRASANLAYHTLRAPFAGEIVAVGPEVGEAVGTAQPVARLVDLSARAVEIGLPAADRAAVLRDGAAFTVADDLTRWPATLDHVAPAADGATLLWTVRLRLDDGPPPGTPVTVTLTLPRAAAGGVLVPARAVEAGQVWRLDGDRPAPVAVEVVDRDADGVVVTGLSVGDRVVMHRNAPLVAGEPVVLVEPPP